MKKTITLESEVFRRVVEDIITRDELRLRLAGKKKLRIKLGIDATSPDLHIGHAVSLWKIRAMQEAGHKAVIILGEFTTRIGDPTGKSQTRQVLGAAVIRKNIASLKKQVEQILLTDPNVYEIRKNSEWHGGMTSARFLELAGMVTHGRLIERDMFRERMREGREITMAEMLYPLLQGYDSVAIKSDLTIIGSDQLFNEHVGRFFQEKFGQAPQSIMTVKILPGLDGGEKMSKSAGNYIGLLDSPKDKFGKAMRVLDSLIIPYMEAYTDIPYEDITRMRQKLDSGLNPRDLKVFFAEALVSRYHGSGAAQKTREEFARVFSEKRTPEEMPACAVRSGTWNPIDLLQELRLVPSRGEGRRLIAQGAVDADGMTVRDPLAPMEISEGEHVIRVGKRRFVRIQAK